MTGPIIVSSIDYNTLNFLIMTIHNVYPEAQMNVTLTFDYPGPPNDRVDDLIKSLASDQGWQVALEQHDEADDRRKIVLSWPVVEGEPVSPGE